MAKDNKSGVGIVFTDLLAITFIVLKLTGVIDWSWIWVLCPLWIGAGVIVVVIIISCIIEKILMIKKKGDEKW